ncbi:MAG TPA: SDR family oxidoreductase [Trebonia sp.]|jgi:NAD(P)-dependent dehydrogenase (short-subunit alcohol dehydrogenase family)|nr:SDR family oxidoreductase [Trebonia sp.]
MNLLQDKTAIVYGAAGPVGAAVAGAFAGAGARVALAGRTLRPLAEVAERIRDAGGHAEAAVVDVLDAPAVRAHAAGVAAASGRIDIAFNATGNDDRQGTPLLDMEFADFARPVSKVIATHFTIATVTARYMTERGGVILALGGGREAIPSLGGSHVAWSALAGLCRQLAAELGPSGIRVAWLLSPGSPDPGRPVSADELAGQTLLGRRPSYADVANAAVFAASDWAVTMTATEINLTGGAVID